VKTQNAGCVVAAGVLRRSSGASRRLGRRGPAFGGVRWSDDNVDPTARAT